MADADDHAGRTIDLSGGQLPAAEVQSRCIEPGGALRFVGGHLSTALDLADVESGRRLTFVDTTFDGPVVFNQARARTVEFIDCRLNGGFTANGAAFDGDLLFTNCELRGTLATPGYRRPASVWLYDASVGGRLVFLSTSVGGAGDVARGVNAGRVAVAAGIRFMEGSVVHGQVRLSGAGIGGSVDIHGSSIVDPHAALQLNDAAIGGNVWIVNDRNGRHSSIVGGLSLNGARVGGQLLVDEATIDAPTQEYAGVYSGRSLSPGVAVNAVRTRFDGDVRFCSGSRIGGHITMAAATVRARLDLDDTTIAAPEAGWRADEFALELANIEVGSDISFHGQSGSIRLENASVSGSLRLEDLAVVANCSEAIEARNARIGGDVWLDRARSTGGDIDFRLSRIAGDWRAPEAEIEGAATREGYAVNLTSSEIGGSAYFNHGFTARGLLRINRATIAGRLNFDNSHLSPSDGRPDDLVVACRSTTVDDLFVDWDVAGTVDLHGTTTNLLADNPTRWGTAHVISGLSYQRLMPSPSSAAAFDRSALADARLRWLQTQSDADPGTYSQLADYYRRHGRTVEADDVLIARNRFLRSERARLGGWRNRVKNMADRAWDIGVGYGFRTSRIAVVLIGLLIVVGGLLASGPGRSRMITTDEDNVVFTASAPCTTGTVRCFNPVFYAVDTVVPLIDLQQRSVWYPTRSLPYGAALEWGLNVAVLMGWVATSALILGFTKTLSADS